ncbi:MAG: hypothetical protein QXO16_08580 [Archaeoglobaceae archaeon]
MDYWIFVAKDFEDVTALEKFKIAKEKLLWGFWHREAGEKQIKYWRDFKKLYDEIKHLDMVFFQRVDTESIHGFGIVKRKYEDFKTLIWPDEQKRGQVLYPYRVSFYLLFFSEDPLATYSPIEAEAKKEGRFVIGYGIGKLLGSEVKQIVAEMEEKKLWLGTIDA